VKIPGKVEISDNKGIRGVWEKFRKKGTKSRIEMSISDGRE